MTSAIISITDVKFYAKYNPVINESNAGTIGYYTFYLISIINLSINWLVNKV